MSEIDEVRGLLGSLLGERLLTREDVAFGETASLVFTGEGEVPALVARPQKITEVSAVVRAAAETGIPFAVRGGGHAYSRMSTVPGGLVLDLRLMGGAALDPDARVGTAFAGTTAGEYTAAAAEHGLATGFGDTLSVGIPGLALGGGIGFLSRRDGLTLDNVLGADLVLADGSRVRASAEENPELFWAVRGGGGNFGVITNLRLRLSHAAVVTGGLLAFAPDPGTLTALLAAAAEAPDELSLMVNVMKAPPAPFIPEERRGLPMIAAIVCHSGAPDRADAVLAPFRAAGAVLVDLVRQQPYPAMFGLAAEMTGMRTAQRSGFFDGVTESRAHAAIEAVAQAPAPVAVLNLRPMGGAIARVSDDATAFAHRDRAMMATIAAVDGDVDRMRAGARWVADTASALGIEGAAYANFVAEVGPAATAAAYPESTLRRLREVKRAFDPHNLFRSNHNIEPAPVAAAEADDEPLSA